MIQVDGLETLAVFQVSRMLHFSGNLTSPFGDGLRLQHFEVESSAGHQLGVCARLHHTAVPDEGDAVSRLDGGQSPSDDDARASLASRVQRVQHDLHVGIDGSFRCSTYCSYLGKGKHGSGRMQLPRELNARRI